jgi:hypothetical protein
VTFWFDQKTVPSASKPRFTYFAQVYYWHFCRQLSLLHIV